LTFADRQAKLICPAKYTFTSSSFAMNSFIDSMTDHFRADDPVVDAKAYESARFRALQDHYRALLNGDIDRFVSYLSEDVEFEIVGPAFVPFLGKWHGKNDVVRAILNGFSMVEQQDPRVLSIVAQGNQIVIVARETGRFRNTGIAYDVHWVQWFSFRDGKIANVRELICGQA
jgi:ketosteroid isomerase-like protein